MKAKSSRWVDEQFPAERTFACQAGYGAFSVSHSPTEAVKEYIAGLVRAILRPLSGAAGRLTDSTARPAAARDVFTRAVAVPLG